MQKPHYAQECILCVAVLAHNDHVGLHNMFPHCQFHNYILVNCMVMKNWQHMSEPEGYVYSSVCFVFFIWLNNFCFFSMSGKESSIVLTISAFCLKTPEASP